MRLITTAILYVVLAHSAAVSALSPNQSTNGPYWGYDTDGGDDPTTAGCLYNGLDDGCSGAAHLGNDICLDSDRLFEAIGPGFAACTNDPVFSSRVLSCNAYCLTQNPTQTGYCQATSASCCEEVGQCVCVGGDNLK